MKELFLIRGLPGSGKSTFAQKIADVWLEADRYFLDKWGNYKFDPTKLTLAHETCQAMVQAEMAVDTHSIAVANTFVRRWEMQPYIDMARTFGYTVTEVTMSGPLYKSVHEVPDETIERMRTNWEKN